MEYKAFYRVMGVPPDATQDAIKRAHRKLARKYHPSVCKEPDAEAHFKEAGEAYEVLKDPEKRAAYDRLGKEWKVGQEFRPLPDWDAGFEFRGGGYTAAGSLRRTRITLHPQRDLGGNLAGAALALDLLERIEELDARLRAMRGGLFR